MRRRIIKVMVAVIVLALLLISCTQGEIKTEENTVGQAASQEITLRNDFQITTLAEGENPVDFVICLPAQYAQIKDIFSKERLSALNDRLAQRGLSELRITLVSNYRFLDESLLESVSELLGKKWDLLYFEEEAFGNELFPELFLPLEEELTDGLLQEGYKMLPKSAWEAGEIYGSIYSAAQPPTVVATGTKISPIFLGQLGLKAEDFYGQDPWKLDALLDVISKRNDEKRFLKTILTGSSFHMLGDDRTDMAGVSLGAQFHMICPYVGVEVREGGRAVNLLESEELAQAAESMGRYVDSGYAGDKQYLLEDITGKTYREYMQEPDRERAYLKMFSIETVYGDQITQKVASGLGDEEGMYQISMGTAYIAERQARPYTVVSRQSDRQEDALRVLNALLTEAPLQNLLVFSEDYQADESGIDRNPRQEWRGLATTPVLLPNLMSDEKYPCEEGKSVYESMEGMYERAKRSAGADLVFDPSAVQEEIVQVKKVAEEIGAALGGTDRIDPGYSVVLKTWTELEPELLVRLKEAGIDKIVEEVNRQLLGGS